MIETIPEIDLIETENGRFLFDLQRSLEDTTTLIQASNVDPSIKSEYSEIIKELIWELGVAVNSYTPTTTVAFSRGAIIKLLSCIDKRNKEEFHLFETVRNVIIRAENSALGFNSEYLTA